MVLDYFTSDLHLDHDNCLLRCNRPFASLEEQLHYILDTINGLPTGSRLYILGDIFVKSDKEYIANFFNRIRRDIQIYITPGNHDARHSEFYKQFADVSPILTINRLYNDQKVKIVMGHMPMTEWDSGQYGSIHLFGHCHGTYDHPGRAIDVGIDSYNKILSLSDIYDLAFSKAIYQPCHNKNNGSFEIHPKRK